VLVQDAHDIGIVGGQDIRDERQQDRLLRGEVGLALVVEEAQEGVPRGGGIRGPAQAQRDLQRDVVLTREWCQRGRALHGASPCPPVTSTRQPATSGGRGTKPVSSAPGRRRSSTPRTTPRCSAQTTAGFSRTASA